MREITKDSAPTPIKIKRKSPVAQKFTDLFSVLSNKKNMKEKNRIERKKKTKSIMDFNFILIFSLFFYIF